MKKIGAFVETPMSIPPYTTINVAEALENARQARGNKSVILEGALTIERSLSECISHYFFGATHEKKTVFESLILDSDLCTFAMKRRLINHIVSEQRLYSSAEKQDFEDATRRVMSLRNAFAHGTLSCRGTQVFLQFFEGGPREVEITDDYLTEVETRLRTAADACWQLKLKMGVTKMQESPDSA